MELREDQDMTLIEDASQIWHKLWSVRLAFFAAILTAIDAGVSYYLTGIPPIGAVLGSAMSLSAGIARLIAQPELSK